ncbi:MAG TPA: LacI family DNA-binding transcriptional regulator [Acidothermaceae bacterium]
MNDGHRNVSLRDVAARAGVSVKTVSNVVNGYPHVTEATRAKVQLAIDELGYTPNLVARHLRGGQSGIIALAVPELALPYFAELASLVVRAAEARGWTVLIDQTDGLRDRERVVVSGIRAHLIDGLIYSPLALSAAEIGHRHSGTPMVLLGERVHGGTADHVAIDNVAAAKTATAHLLAGGRKRVAAIGYQGSASGQTARLRARGYEEALAAAGRRNDPKLHAATTSFHREDGAQAMQRLLDMSKPPDAVFCFNDLLALGALRTLLRRGVKVPDDVAVIGFDDVEEARFATPALSTVRPDKEEIARVSVDYLLDRVVGEQSLPAREYVAAHSLVIRESSSRTA